MNKDLTDLLTEFDEMGYAPTTLTGEPEKAASEWKKRLIEAIEAENASLRERLDKAVELPVKIGDRVFCIVGQKPAVEEFEVIEIKTQSSSLLHATFRFQGIEVGYRRQAFYRDMVSGGLLNLKPPKSDLRSWEGRRIMIKQLVKLGEVTNEKEFSFDDGISRNLKDFILSFPYIYFKSGVWNKYTKVTPEKAIELCNNSLYGGDIELKYDEKWEAGEVNGKADIFICCPCESDMW